MKHMTLGRQFWLWVLAGLIFISGLGIWINRTCAVNPSTLSKQFPKWVCIESQEQASKEHRSATGPDKIPPDCSAVLGYRVLPDYEPNTSARDDHIGNGRIDSIPEISVCKTKIPDLWMIYLTYCLVVVGYFQIRRSEKTVRELERAHIVCGPVNGGALGLKIIDGKTRVYICVSNNGRTAAIVKECAVCFALEEPVGTPNYTGAKIIKYDTGVGPNIAKIVLSNAAYFSEITVPHHCFGYLKYVDIFKETHTNRFCVKIDTAAQNVETSGPEAWSDFD